jgi:hypothetical protein
MVFKNLGFNSAYNFRWKLEGIVVSAKDLCSVEYGETPGSYEEEEKKREKAFVLFLPSIPRLLPTLHWAMGVELSSLLLSLRLWVLRYVVKAKRRERTVCEHSTWRTSIWRKFFVTRKLIFILQYRLWIVDKNQCIVSVKVVIFFWLRIIFNM